MLLKIGHDYTSFAFILFSIIKNPQIIKTIAVNNRFVIHLKSHASENDMKNRNDNPPSIVTGIRSALSLVPNTYSSKRPAATAKIKPGHIIRQMLNITDSWHTIPVTSRIPPGTSIPASLFLFEKKE